MSDTKEPSTAPAETKTAASEEHAPTLKQVAAEARAKAVRSLERIIKDLPEPGDSGDLHLSGTRAQLQHCIDLINLHPSHA